MSYKTTDQKEVRQLKKAEKGRVQDNRTLPKNSVHIQNVQLASFEQFKATISVPDGNICTESYTSVLHSILGFFSFFFLCLFNIRDFTHKNCMYFQHNCSIIKFKTQHKRILVRVRSTLRKIRELPIAVSHNGTTGNNFG